MNIWTESDDPTRIAIYDKTEMETLSQLTQISYTAALVQMNHEITVCTRQQQNTHFITNITTI